MSVELLLRAAGGLQLLQTAAIISGQRGLGWTRELQRLTPLGRSFVYSIAAGIYLYVTGTGVITVIYAQQMATTDLGTAFCVLQALAWSVRAAFQFLSMRPAWKDRARWLHYAMCVVYTSIASIYAVVSLLRLANVAH